MLDLLHFILPIHWQDHYWLILGTSAFRRRLQASNSTNPRDIILCFGICRLLEMRYHTKLPQPPPCRFLHSLIGAKTPGIRRTLLLQSRDPRCELFMVDGLASLQQIWFASIHLSTLRNSVRDESHANRSNKGLDEIGA